MQPTNGMSFNNEQLTAIELALQGRASA